MIVKLKKAVPRVCGPLCKLAFAFAEMTPAPATAPGTPDTASETSVGVERDDETWLRTGLDIEACRPPAIGVVLAFGATGFGIDGDGELIDDSIGDEPLATVLDVPNKVRESSDEFDEEPETEGTPPPLLAVREKVMWVPGYCAMACNVNRWRCSHTSSTPESVL